MTDSEIVKDLNEAEDLENVLLYCKNPNKEVMTPIKITDIRDLINRLQAENERLKENEVIADGYADALVEYTKAEAYKECIEKAKNNILPMLTTATLEEKETICFCLNKLDNLLKELVGEE